MESLNINIDINIPSSDLLHADFVTTSKYLTADRLAKAELKRQSQHDRNLKIRNAPRPPPGSQTETQRKPKRVPKLKLTAKEKTEGREEREATKKQRTAARKAQKGEKVRHT
jgi:hypothetical protein